MLQNLSLFRKGLLLVSVPLLSVLIFVASFAYIQGEAQKEREYFYRSKEVSDIINRFTRDAYLFMKKVSLCDLENLGHYRVDRKPTIKRGLGYLSRLKVLLKDSPDAIDQIKDIEQIIKDIDKQMDDAEVAWNSGDKETYMRIRKESPGYTNRLLTSEFVSLARQYKEVVGETKRESELRKEKTMLLLFWFPLSIVISLSLALVVCSDITNRIKRLLDNSIRLANDEPLEPPLRGKDEIGEIDRLFHEMAVAISDARAREHTLIANSRAVLCTIDRGGRLSSVNSAVVELLGYEPTELAGKWVSDLIDADDFGQFADCLNGIISGASQSRQLDAQMTRKDGRKIDTTWSLEWVPADHELICVWHDSTERKRAIRMREEIVTMVTEDLRKPLVRMIANHEELREVVTQKKNAKHEMTGQLLGRVKKATDKMTTLIDDLIDIEHITTGQLQLNKSPVPVSEILEGCHQIVSGMAHENSVKIEVLPGNAEIICDKERILQVVINLTSNAIKFSPKGSTVTLFCEPLADHLDIAVQDRGRGVPEAQRERIFNRFTQVETADASKKGGAGLGLAICKGLVELHGGSIWVENTPGGGSTFKFRLPSKSGGAA